MQILFIIPARGGSKGIPGKNIKLLGGKPLIHYSIEYARLFSEDSNICLTTDDLDIAKCAKQIGYDVPFIRPSQLATDSANSYDVLRHALSYYIERGKYYDAIVLLQPTSPFRLKQHLQEAMVIYKPDMDMVVSVTETGYNPYYNLFEKNERGFLCISKGNGAFTRRQDAPPVYAYNGSLYIINASSLLAKGSFKEFEVISGYNMASKYSIDLDIPDDWLYAEYICKNYFHENS